MVDDHNLSLETVNHNSTSVAACTALEQRFIFNSKVSTVLPALPCALDSPIVIDVLK